MLPGRRLLRSNYMLNKPEKSLVWDEDENQEPIIYAKEVRCNKCGCEYTVLKRIDNKHCLMNICENPRCFRYINKDNLTEWITIDQECPPIAVDPALM